MIVDLRSDTVTKPTQAMRNAMANAEVGDDVFGEDPTVRLLEERVADLLGKEAGLFVPSGVMGNQIAIAVQTSPGDEVIVAERSHIFHYETGAAAHISGVQLRPVGDLSGILRAADVDAVVQGTYDWEARTSLVCLENSVNKSGGRVYPMEAILEVAETTKAHGLPFHLDGARLWNAAVEMDMDERDIVQPFDSISVCLSKGLGAPVGSVLVGDTSMIAEARRMRKRLGGGMRQVGILAAAGLLALDQRKHLKDDHVRTKRFAAAFDNLSAFTVVAPETNIVLIETNESDASSVIATMEGAGIRFSQFGPTTIRATFHRDVTDHHVDYANERILATFG